MSSASKVGELFKAAGQVFCHLGDLTAQLEILPDRASPNQPLRPKKKDSIAGVGKSALVAKRPATDVTAMTSPAKKAAKRKQSFSDQGDLDVDIEGMTDRQSASKVKLEYHL